VRAQQDMHRFNIEGRDKLNVAAIYLFLAFLAQGVAKPSVVSYVALDYSEIGLILGKTVKVI